MDAALKTKNDMRLSISENVLIYALPLTGESVMTNSYCTFGNDFSRGVLHL